VRLFLDTEFTGLAESIRLISIALVPEEGDRCLYAELADGWTTADCTPWVLQHVVATLDRNPETTMTRVEAADRLRLFLADFSEAVICFDSEHDRRHLLDLLGALPAHVTLENINSEVDQEVFDGFFGGRTDLQHHALTDARALAYAYRVTTEMRLRAMRDRDDVC
jgi:hypothetical protein